MSGLTGAVHSEVRKVFTTRLWWGMALGMAALAAMIAAGFAALVGLDQGGGPGPDQGNPFAAMSVGTAQIIYNAGMIQSLTTLFPLTLGILLITSEYRHQTITATFLATPGRWTVMASKMVAAALIGLVFAVVHLVASVAGGVSVLTLVKDVPTLLGEREVQISLGIALIAFMVWTLFGFGVGMLIRNQIAAVLIGVGAAFIVQIALNILFTFRGWFSALKWLPGNLTNNMLVTSDPTAGQNVDPATAAQFFDHWWQAALVLTAYALVLAVAGAALTTRRDVS